MLIGLIYVSSTSLFPIFDKAINLDSLKWSGIFLSPFITYVNH